MHRVVIVTALILVGTVVGATAAFVYLPSRHVVLAEPARELAPVVLPPQTSVAVAAPVMDRFLEIDRLLAKGEQAAQEREILFEQLLDLEQRLNELIAKVEVLAEQPSAAPSPGSVPPAVATAPVQSEEPPLPMQAYLDVGLDPVQVEDIQRRLANLEMDRLYLRDQAIREGWIDSERYTERLRELELGDGTLREELGDDAFDRFLYASGRSNRVRIQSVIGGSPADLAGLLSGDVVVSYAGQRILRFGDLTEATTAGDAGAQVRLSIKRGESSFDVFVPRGPLGVRLANQRLAP